LVASKSEGYHLPVVENHFDLQNPALCLNNQKAMGTWCTHYLQKQHKMKKGGTERVFGLDSFEGTPICLPCLFMQNIFKHGGCSPQFPNNPNLSSDR
jgi:hypothetical protein